MLTERVFVEDENEAALNSIRDNKTEGAASLTKETLEKALKGFIDRTIQQGKALPVPIFEEKLKNYCWHLMNIRPSMAPIANSVILAVAAHFKDNSYESSETMALDITGTITKLIESQKEYGDKIIEQFNKLIPNSSSILTFSYSGTVVRTLCQTDKHLKIYIAESRPMNEGRTTARLLLERGKSNSVSNVTLIPDAAIAKIIVHDKLVGCCVVGADSILGDGSVVNKTGRSFILSSLLNLFRYTFDFFGMPASKHTFVYTE